jgi:hypothetical protein
VRESAAERSSSGRRAISQASSIGWFLRRWWVDAIRSGLEESVREVVGARIGSVVWGDQGNLNESATFYIGVETGDQGRGLATKHLSLFWDFDLGRSNAFSFGTANVMHAL